MTKLLKCNAFVVILVVMLFLFSSCFKGSYSKANIDLNDCKITLCDYLEKNNYSYNIEDDDLNGFIIELDNNNIDIIIEKENNGDCYYNIYQTNELNNIDEKYDINYDLIIELSSIFKENKVTKKDLQTVVESEKSLNKTENDSNSIIHKEKSFGFYDVPKIDYSITYDNENGTYEEELSFVDIL